MTNLTNSFEGGTSGTAITTGNSGGTSGSAFDAADAGVASTVAFDNAHAHSGSLSCKIATGVTADNWGLSWTTSMGSQSQIWFRLYIYFTANPSGLYRLWACRPGPSTCGAIVLNVNGTVKFSNTAGVTIFTTTNTIALNQWVRLEGFLIGSATVGQVELKLFNTTDSTTPTETQTSNALQNTSGVPINYIFGDLGNGSANVAYWQDDLGLSSTGYLGPVVPTSFSDTDLGSGADSGLVTVSGSGGDASTASSEGPVSVGVSDVPRWIG